MAPTSWEVGEFQKVSLCLPVRGFLSRSTDTVHEASTASLAYRLIWGLWGLDGFRQWIFFGLTKAHVAVNVEYP